MDGVGFSLAAGRTLGLVGESGCGKSMLARALMGLLPRDAVVGSAARIEYDGRSLIQMAPKQLRAIIGREIAMVFQDPLTSLNPVMRVGRQICEVLIHHLKLEKKAARQRATELLQQVAVPMPEKRFDQFPHQLSGGLRQRVAIAIALACEPRLLIADEPTSALDVTVQAGILDLLAAHQQEKQMAQLLISHDLGVVAGRAHTTAVMYAGRIVEMAPTEALFGNMRMPYTRALLNAVPRLGSQRCTRLRTIDGQPSDLVHLPPGCAFAPRCGRAHHRCYETVPELRNGDAQDHWFACWHPLAAL
jgi:peptide/nickel transport system ATP-binding protein